MKASTLTSNLVLISEGVGYGSGTGSGSGSGVGKVLDTEVVLARVQVVEIKDVEAKMKMKPAWDNDFANVPWPELCQLLLAKAYGVLKELGATQVDEVLAAGGGFKTENGR